MNRLCRTIIHLGLVCLLLTSGCLGDGAMEDGDAIPVNGTGTIVYMGLDGGFYGITADDGTSYLPVGLDPAYEADGLPVAFEGVARNDIAEISRWGVPLDIRKISPLAEGDTAVLWEGGRKRYLGDSSTEIVPALHRTLERINLQLRCVVSEAELGAMQETGRLVELTLVPPREIATRLVIGGGGPGSPPGDAAPPHRIANVTSAVFILGGENEGESFGGHILVRSAGDSVYGCYAVVNEANGVVDRDWEEELRPWIGERTAASPAGV